MLVCSCGVEVQRGEGKAVCLWALILCADQRHHLPPWLGNTQQPSQLVPATADSYKKQDLLMEADSSSSKGPKCFALWGVRRRVIFLLCVTPCLSRCLLGLGLPHSAEQVLSLSCK